MREAAAVAADIPPDGVFLFGRTAPLELAHIVALSRNMREVAAVAAVFLFGRLMSLELAHIVALSRNMREVVFFRQTAVFCLAG